MTALPSLVQPAARLADHPLLKAPSGRTEAPDRRLRQIRKHLTTPAAWRSHPKLTLGQRARHQGRAADCDRAAQRERARAALAGGVQPVADGAAPNERVLLERAA
eukprot:6190958-Pleurochrysis_carterae.AAC.1